MEAITAVCWLIKDWFLLGTILVRLFEASATRKWSFVFLDWGVAIGHDAIPWVMQESVQPGLAQILQGASFGRQNWGRLSYLSESNCRAKKEMIHGYREIWKGCMSAWQFKIYCHLEASLDSCPWNWSTWRTCVSRVGELTIANYQEVACACLHDIYSLWNHQTPVRPVFRAFWVCYKQEF